MNTPARSTEGDDTPGTSGGTDELREDHSIELLMPATPELRKVGRLVASSIATLVGFDIEELADLRLAADELCMAVASGALDGCRLKMTISWDEQAIAIACSASPVSEVPDRALDEDWPGGLDPARLSERILEATTDEFIVETVADATRNGWLRKAR